MLSDEKKRTGHSNSVMSCDDIIIDQFLNNTNVITRHNAVAMSRDQQSWGSSFSLIQTYLLFPVFNL